MWNQIFEDAIIGKLVVALVDGGYRVELCDQDGGGVFLYAVPEAGEKPSGGFQHWVRLALGNGCDVIVDYTTNLEAVLKPVNAFAALFQK